MSISTTLKLLIVHKFGQTKVTDLLNRAVTIWTAMLAAALTFAEPPVAMALFKQHIDSLTASVAAAMGGATKDITQRNNDRHEIEQDLMYLGAYVVKVANGDPAIVALSGFVAAPLRTHSAPQPLTPPAILSVDQGQAGELLVALEAKKGGRGYDVRRSPVIAGAPAAWVIVTATSTRIPVSITDLTAGTMYEFQARVLGRRGYSDWGNSSTRMCI